ncbi:MAG: TonB-dependent receptor plug domain-containing protein, partial [Bacteroidales bacterium]|nr:TonB-dependent receptor plug domain-containing protein [Bacteroidales bacterium]
MKIKLVLSFIAIVMAISGQTIRAQSEIQIEEILVSNTKIIDLPESKIFDEQIKLIAPRDIGDIFKSMTGFGVIKRGGYAMEPVFRSFKYEQINMMFDGSMKIVPACPNRMDPITTHVNPEEISKIEIIKGPYSVRYGQSFGGIINLVTRKKTYTDKLEFHGLTSAGYQTNGGGKTLGLNLNTGNKYFDFDISGGLKDFGNYKSGWDLEIPSSFKSYDYAIKIGVNPTSNQRVLVSWRQSFGRDIMHAGLPMDTEKDDSRMLSFDYTIRNLNDLIFEFNIKAYYSDVDHIMSNINRPNYAMSNAVANVFSKTYGGKIEAGISIAENNILYTGIDYTYVWKDGDRQRKVFYNACSGMSFDTPMEFTDLIWQNSNLSNFGYFIESKNNLSERLSLIGGLRIDLDNAQINDPAKDFESMYPEGFEQDGIVSFSGNLT